MKFQEKKLLHFLHQFKKVQETFNNNSWKIANSSFVFKKICAFARIKLFRDCKSWKCRSKLMQHRSIIHYPLNPATCHNLHCEWKRTFSTFIFFLPLEKGKKNSCSCVFLNCVLLSIPLKNSQKTHRFPISTEAEKKVITNTQINFDCVSDELTQWR